MIKEKSVNYLLIILLIISVSANLLAWGEIQNLDKEARNEEKAESVFPEEELREKYTSELGFSIKIPQKVCGVYRCSSNKTIWVPVKVFEDKENGIVFITQEYYYDNWNSESQNNTRPCEKIICSLELLQSEWMTSALWDENKPFSLLSEKTFLGWGILIGSIKSESELNKFIKDNYGPGCFAQNKKPWKQNGIYEIEIGSEDQDKGTDLGTTTCPINYVYKVLYAPEKSKIMSVKLGQECTFGTNPASYLEYKCYDEKMIDSFKFE